MNILISACLMGIPCRYDGKCKNKIDLCKVEKDNTLFPVCPETDGGLGIPRPPAEISDGRVINTMGVDVTDKYTDGAIHALNTAKENNCTVAILKAKSPSCGKGEIYDGTFTKTLTRGNGITAELLMKNGITVYTENEIELLYQ